MTESQLQAKIVKYLEGRGFIVTKIMIANKAGTPDLIACDAYGRFWAIEVKTEKGTLSLLQEVKIKKIQTNCGRAFACFGWDDFLAKYKRYETMR
jgi:Holliday junction resolvase